MELGVYCGQSPLPLMQSAEAWDLWVTGASSDLRQKLTTTTDLQSTLLIQPSTFDEPDRLSQGTLDLIADTLQCRHLRSVIVCQQLTPEDADPQRSTRAVSSRERRQYNEVLMRIRAHKDAQQRLESRVLSQMDQIRRDSRIGKAMSSQETKLYGMVYIPKSDAFLIYDRAIDSFVPIREAR